MKKNLTLLAFALLGAAGSAQAALVSYSDSISLTLTNWNSVLTLHQFDATLGNLQSVTFLYAASVTSTFKAENRSSTAATLIASASATIDFAAPVSQNLKATNTVSQAVSAYDGRTDYAGTSAFSPNPVILTQNAGNSVSYSSDLGSFIGNGSYFVPVQASANSSISGSSNLASSISTVASAGITVNYEYTAPAIGSSTNVPEPGSLALVGLALSGLAAASRLRARR